MERRPQKTDQRGLEHLRGNEVHRTAEWWCQAGVFPPWLQVVSGFMTQPVASPCPRCRQAVLGVSSTADVTPIYIEGYERGPQKIPGESAK